MVQGHFSKVLCHPSPRQHDLNWDLLNLPMHDLSTLDAPFTEEELKTAIQQMPADKAPGPDGFTGAFFTKCWEIIKADVLKAANAFHLLRTSNLSILNSANIVLEGPDSVGDYRPISLIHSFAKIISKVLAMRLAPHMDNLVSPSQSAFIKKRNIHESFLAVRNTVRRLHRNRVPALFFKLDITKAFDSVRWEYLLTLLKRLGFPPRWCGWIAVLLSTASSRVLVNGVPSAPIKHGRGLRQGDPLSPLLFVLSIDPLQNLLDLATSLGYLAKLRVRAATLRVSMYADDAAIFLKPAKRDTTTLMSLLVNFGDALGLVTNAQKSTVVPIRCEGLDLEEILASFRATRTQFPVKYLGLPLSNKRLKRVDFQPLVDKVAKKLTAWNGRHINPAGRLTLVKSVLTSQAVYFISSLRVPKSTLKEIDTKRKRFLWAGSEALTGAKCKVNWPRSTRPVDLGGLGVLHLGKFARGLRLRWLWREWNEGRSLEIGSENPCNKKDRLLFAAATSISIGNGKKISFWHSGWLQGQRPCDLAPRLYAISKNKKRSLEGAVQNKNWIKDIDLRHRNFSAGHFLEYVRLWRAVQNLELQPNNEDAITWKFTSSGEYSSNSAYRAQFFGSVQTNLKHLIWQTWAPLECKFFSWLAIQNRIWTSDRLHARGWDNAGQCPLCRRAPESGIHLFAECRFTRCIWKELSSWTATQGLDPRN
ncbi:hypothetical protein U9M48_005227 [Paspalum notatum var. saurae]|uniref:Reverse transcriptase domain-containing protein n=1 Tax=Paspalum notatum var. saurae TaxID=547442 RepID=A0AAQ3SLB5_PASNO